MLKRLWFAAAVLLAASRAGLAQQPVALVVGSVRDEAGNLIDQATVEAYAASGRQVGAGSIDRLGTFALHLSGAAARLRVDCRYCARVTLLLEGRSNVAIVVTRYHALEHDVPDEADLAALPYGRVADVLALVPYVVPTGAGASVSDRGLGGGAGLVIDALAPLGDLSTGHSGFADVPDRYTRSLTFARANQAFRYGSGAGGGVFAVDQLDPQQSSAAVDAGAASTLALEPRLGIVYPAVGVSSDDGRSIRRADLDLESGFAGGVLRAGATTASNAAASAYDAGGDLRSLRLAYATASRRYRTFADATASDLDVGADATGASAYRSSYLSGSFRLERPGPLEFDAGASAQHQSGSYVLPLPEAYLTDGTVADDSLYLEAHANGARGSFDAALALSKVAERDGLPSGTLAGNGFVLLPSLSGQLALAGPLSARAGFSESVRIPTLLEAAASTPGAGTFALDRDELAETALDYDAGARVRAELTIFREFSHGFDERRLDGIGANLVWQLAPRISLRVWSLRDDPADFTTPATLDGDVSRQVVWATYENPAGLRVDALARRAAGLTAPGIDLDGDVVVPLLPRAALDAGSSRLNGVRRYFLGVRLH